MHEQKPQLACREADLARQRAHPVFVRVAGVRERVVVRDLRVMVVARIGVAAMTVGGARGERLFVIALDAFDTARDQQLRHAIGVRPERAEVAEEIGAIDAAPRDVVERGDQRVVVRIDAAEECCSHKLKIEN
jgi:hypothetical protein